ncbi:MAG: type I-U CRISPR-associated helicase/endonuclease Cas3 [Acidimicrobiia bacterium]|nr:type I-U CRISPR-associated helicase/endonuclease Cas3 [Acidimicrobiia bacterium]
MGDCVTSDPPIPPAPTFEDFYSAVNDRPPFPWQERLARQVAAGESWPEEIGLPTGLGKTACLDVAVWWLASQAHLPAEDRTAPTRIWWVVNRRLLVDSTGEHAERISGLLSDAAGDASAGGAQPEAIRAVALRLRSLAVDADSDPLEVIRLRGGVAWRRPTDPSQPAVILSTIPMYGSRLLFRGYGSSRSMRPIDAALAGIDSLVLVDEAHLARHLMKLFPALDECAPARRNILNEARSTPRVVSLTATGGPRGRRFDLDAADESNPEIIRRLDAPKPTEIWAHDKPDQVRPLVEATTSLLESAAGPSSCVVFVNSPETARAVKTRLLKEKRSGLTGDDVVVLTGRTREREAAAARKRILNAMRASSANPPRSRHLVVVATQTLEVGADIDAELMVTEACGVRALIQRLGRLNRLGSYPQARAIYVHCPPRGSDNLWPVYGREPAVVLERLQRAAGEGGVVNLAPRGIAEVLGDPEDDPGRAPEILPALLWEWIKTTTPPPGEAPVDPYFSGIARPERSVSVMWRAYVPEAGAYLWPRPREEEILDVGIGTFRDAFDGSKVLSRLGPDGVTVEDVNVSAVRPGDRIVLPSDWGLLDMDGWNPDHTGVVADLSVLRRGLPLDARALRGLCDDPADGGKRLPTERLGRLLALVIGDAGDGEEADDAACREALESLLEMLVEYPPSSFDEADYRDAGLAGWHQFISGLARDLPPDGPRREVPHLALQRTSDPSVVEELDEMSLTEAATALDVHGVEVGARAARLASALGASDDLCAIMHRAGSFHDVGKADGRFQRWLDPRGEATRLVAKSAMPKSRWSAARAASGWPAGGRHEELSGRLVAEWLTTGGTDLTDDEADLLMHLVVSHHGRGRPLVLPVTDGSPGLVSHELDGVEVSCSADLATVDWSQPSRFRRLNDLHGPWGLALLEAIVRQADHCVSAGARVKHMEVY